MIYCISYTQINKSCTIIFLSFVHYKQYKQSLFCQIRAMLDFLTWSIKKIKILSEKSDLNNNSILKDSFWPLSGMFYTLQSRRMFSPVSRWMFCTIPIWNFISNQGRKLNFTRRSKNTRSYMLSSVPRRTWYFAGRFSKVPSEKGLDGKEDEYPDGQICKVGDWTSEAVSS